MITLQFATERGISSWAIRAYSHGFPSHVDMVLPDGRLLGARSAGGVQARAPGYAAFSKVMRFNLPASPVVTQSYLDHAMRQIGKPYDWQSIVAFAVDRDWRNPDAWMCSELQAWLSERSGLFPGRIAAPNNRITPRDHMLIVSPWAV